MKLLNLLNPRVCRSWRFVTVREHDNHSVPGECRECWVPCTNTLTREEYALGIRRCSECVQALMHCPIVAIRRALLDEPNVSDEILRALRTDPNGPISSLATRIIDERKMARSPRSATDPLELKIPSPRREHRQLSVQSHRDGQLTPASRHSVWGN